MNNKPVYFTLPGLFFISITGWAATDNSSDTMPSSSTTLQTININTQPDFNPLQLSYTSRGPECPATSGSYCAEGYNYCCLINDEWTCVVELKDCRND